MKGVNKLYFLIGSALFLLFISLLTFKYISQSGFDELLTKLDDLKEEDLELQYKLIHAKRIEEDLKISTNELAGATRLIKETQNLVDEILNLSENLYSKYQSKSVSAVNGELNRLLPALRQRCEASNISFKRASVDSSFGFESGSGSNNEDAFGFGFASYDGFWPNFTKQEANLLGLQGAIIKEMVEFLVNATEENPITLVSVKRQTVGAADQKHIMGDLLVTKELPLLSSAQNISSLCFEISFLGQTDHARTFVNQLRFPYSLRKFSVSREISDERSDANDGLFSSNQQESDQDILPIINDIESKFVLIIEYIYRVDYNVENIFRDAMQIFSKNSLEKKILEEFKESSSL